MTTPNTPVIIGVAQWTVHRGEQPGPEPLDGWQRVCLAALEDALPDAQAISTACC